MSDNIKVVVKVRPLIPREEEEKLFYQWRVQNDTLYQIDQNGKDVGPAFTFDKVYDKDTKTCDVYNDIAKPIVKAATDGFNGTIFAYGQTSSGKTYTMTGTEDAPGIIPLAVHNLFEIIKGVPNRDFLVRVSYVEIYNETLIDLLNIDKKNIKIHDTLQGVKVDAMEKVTSSTEEVLDAMKEGKANRQTGSTNMNEESSRSHSIFQITIESREHTEGEDEGGCVNVSQLNLVDLAGSERAGQTGTTGLRFKEGTHINKSLSCLALVIKQLSDDPSRPYRHVNYRDSKLTRILQNSLGGNAKTSIICAVTPAAVEETISTLQFANRAKAIKNKPAVNAVATNATMIQQLTKELCTLKTELENKKTLEKDNYSLQKRIVALQRLILNGFSQRSTAEMLNPRRKLVQPRRITIAGSLHSIQEDPLPTVPKFCTPSLKYNPLVLPGAPDFQPVHGALSLPSLPEEPPRLVTPPPRGKKVNFEDEIIELDSDDESTPDLQTCPTSPYHKCYESSKTPPCILRKNAKRAEKNLKDIVELTEREKIFTPTVVELMEKMEQNATVITKLEDEINQLKESNKEKDTEMDKLKSEISKAEEKIKMISSAKMELEGTCLEYKIMLTDSEVSYETLKRKSKSREQELLSLLEERAPKKTVESIGKLSTINENDISKNFLDASRDISLVNSDNEQSINADMDTSQPSSNLVTDVQPQLAIKDDTIKELQATISAYEEQITSLGNINKEYETMLGSCKDNISRLEKEVVDHKNAVDSLNKIIETQTENIESVNVDIESYKKLIQELQVKLKRDDNININDNQLENLIANEETFIANNENIRNIIICLRLSLQSKNKEIETLKTSLEKNNVNANIEEELSTKNKEVAALTEDIQRLKIQIDDNVITINKMLLEQKNWSEVEEQLSSKLNELEESKSNLTKENERLRKQAEEQQAAREELDEKILKRDQEFTSTCEKHTKEIEDMCHKINTLEEENLSKDSIITSLNKSQEETQEHFMQAKSALHKVQSIMTVLTGNIQNVPDIIDNFVSLFNTLSNNLSRLEKIASEIISQKRGLVELIETCEKEYVNIEKQINDIIENLEDADLEKFECLEQTLSLERFNETHVDTNNSNAMPNEMQQLLHERQSAYKKMYGSIEKLIGVLKMNRSHYQQKLHSKDIEIDALKVNIVNCQNNLEVKSKESLIALQEKDDVIKKRDQFLNKILNKSTDILLYFNIENNISCNLQDDDDNIHELILLTLDKIANYIEITNNKHESDNIEEVLMEAKKEIRELTEQNLKFMKEISRIENANVDLSEALDKIREENKMLAEDLENSSNVLELLRKELTCKVKEMECIEAKAQQSKDQLVNLDFLMKEQMHALQLENMDLRSRYVESVKMDDKYNDEHSESDSNNDSSSYQRSICLDINTDLKSPQSLLTLCCNRIIDAIQPNENKSLNASSHGSNMNINENDQQHTTCRCDNMETELKEIMNENSKLRSTVDQLENNNKELLKEHSEVQNEVKLLLDISYELQKKVVNHRTNLSTLTATTYAENKLLSSQIKFLQHHHNRFHHVCQRDIPEFKKQLQELMTLLKTEQLIPNDTFKRFSLPNALDATSLHSNFKNESTLDGDLLMLDTNITLTTTGDTTLVGHDQTCFDATQICVYNEVACQTTDLSSITDENLLNSQILINPNENNELVEKLEELKKENNKLRDLVDDYMITKKSKVDNQTSPIKPKNSDDSFSEALNYEDLLNTQEHHLKEIDSLSQKILSLESEKADILQKYNNLLLEVPSTDALVKKLNLLEKEHTCKTNELDLLKSVLNNKKEEMITLQNENDSLSTQVMEAISEVDDLKKQHDNLELLNSQLTERYTKLQHDMNTLEANYESVMCSECPRCESKNKLIRSLQEKLTSEPHARLSRSFSDSERSSNYNTICTLQSELHAGKEDCNKLKEEVTTIKNHLDRSNLSMGQEMDLDDSLGEPNNFAYAKDFDSVESNRNMPDIPEERPLDIYGLDKTDCFNYFIEITGADKEDFSYDIKIIDVMKMLYNNIIAKHSNEVENLINKLRDFEDSKKELQSQLENITKEYSEQAKQLQEKDSNLEMIENVLTNIKNNKLHTHNKDAESDDIIQIFKDSILKPLDIQFGINSTVVFDSVLNMVFNKFKSKLDSKTDQCSKLEDEFNTINNNIIQLKSQLTQKEKDYDLLKKQKDKIQEISNAVTLDIVKKEQELHRIITDGCTKLSQNNILEHEDISRLLPLSKNVETIFDLVVKHFNDKNISGVKEQNNNLSQEVANCKTIIEMKDLELRNLTGCLQGKESDLSTQTALIKDLKQIYDKKVEENNTNLNIIHRMHEEINMLKESLLNKDTSLQTLQSSLVEKQKPLEDKVKELLQSIDNLHSEIANLKSINEKIVKEKDDYAKQLEESKNTIQLNKKELETMTSDILVLKESVKENVNLIENLKQEIKLLFEQNTKLNEQLQEKTKDCSRLENNIKTHEKTAEIQSRMIMRLQKQKEDDSAKDKEIEELKQKCTALQKECDSLNQGINNCKEEIQVLGSAKQSLEMQIHELQTELQEAHKPRLSMDRMSDVSRRRRQSLLDSKRMFDDKDGDDHNKMEVVSRSHSKTEDSFMDTDGIESNRSTPLRLSKGRDSSQCKNDQSEEDPPSRPSSVLAARRRRQSAHDLHRSVLSQTPSPHDLPRKLSDLKDFEKIVNHHSDSEVMQLKNQLASCQEELEDLKEKYRELDEECETCAQYLQERDSQCSRLRKEKLALEQVVAELKAKSQQPGMNRSGCKNSFCDAAVNTDEDWTNLHSVVVDRMSYNAEVEKNKKLTKAIEELRFKKQDLKNTIAKMQKALEKKSLQDNRELEATKSELHACKQELEELKERYKELDEECETCAEYLRERDAQCLKLKEAKIALEAKLKEYEEDANNITLTVRKKRQTLHDQNRLSTTVEFVDASTETNEDFLSYQVEKDNSRRISDDDQIKELTRLKMALRQLAQQKAALEQRVATPLYVATGSAIVQNQQLTDVMKENQKLKKINAKLITICKKRGKTLSESNRENQDPSENI
ncbi:uncharacterized protein [Epargyreus clarus]|uniref:uncharacterized protein isoform X1 n=1 Tax=Epargyreus clarus TaxID=520877 RepID=UPI003C2B056C